MKTVSINNELEIYKNFATNWFVFTRVLKYYKNSCIGSLMHSTCLEGTAYFFPKYTEQIKAITTKSLEVSYYLIFLSIFCYKIFKSYIYLQINPQNKYCIPIASNMLLIY